MLKHNVKLMDIIPHLDFLMHVKLFIEADDPEEPVFQGTVLDVPWIFLTLELDTDDNGEAISISCEKETDKPYLIIYLKEVNE